MSRLRAVGSSAVDRVNRRAWARPGVVDFFSHLETWSEDAGEATLLARIADEVRGQPILDVGVGGGRTVPALRAISRNYVGVDYTPEMVAVAAARFPDVDIRHGDARDLSDFRDGSFALVFFSANGIDAVSHDDRRLVLREAHRVLRPGGVFAFSTHNFSHQNAGKAPWDPRQVWPRDIRRIARRFVRLPHAIRGHVRNRGLVVRGDSWAMLNTPLYDFGLVIHYVSLAAAIEELATAGFGKEVEVYDALGERVASGAEAGGTKWFHLLARVPGESV
jgi:SAM-dependent methyltransferase